MPAFVISPWACTGAVVHTRYDQLSVIRTVELLLGLDPLSLGDSLAEPMYDAFVIGSTSDLRLYTAVQPARSLAAVNTAPTAGLEGALPYEQHDLVPQALFDAVDLHAARGQPIGPGPWQGHAMAVTTDGRTRAASRQGTARRPETRCLAPTQSCDSRSWRGGGLVRCSQVLARSTSPSCCPVTSYHRSTRGSISPMTSTSTGASDEQHLAPSARA